MSDKKTTGIDWVFEWQKEDSVAIRAAGFVYRGSPDMGFAELCEWAAQIALYRAFRSNAITTTVVQIFAS